MDKTDCEELRRLIKAIADKVWWLHKEAVGGDPGQAIANLVLAYRHLKVASMRLGKAIQALDGGTSVYDKTPVPGL